MLRSRHAVLATLVSVATVSTARAQFAVTVDSTARYQGAPFQSASQTVTNPPLVLGDVASAFSLSDPALDGYSFARGEARFGYDALGGYSRNFARASGWAPSFGPPDEVYATSNSNATAMYRVSSASTPVGTPIQIRCFLAYTGTLGVANYFGSTNPGELTATFGSTFTIDGVSYFDASATLEQRFSNSQSPPIFTTTGPWGGAWTSSTETDPSGSEYNAMTLAYTDVVNFNTVMSADFDVAFTQYAAAQIPGPFEAFAMADFTNTGRFSFQAFDAQTGERITDAQFNIIPTPGAASVGLALLAFASCRRRR